MVSEYLKAYVQIQRAPICEPVGDQYVARCQWSKTGWAVWNADGGCTCQPALAPVISEDSEGR